MANIFSFNVGHLSDGFVAALRFSLKDDDADNDDDMPEKLVYVGYVMKICSGIRDIYVDI